MKLYTSSFQLLDECLCIFTSMSGWDSIIENESMTDMLSYFFEMDDETEDELIEYWSCKLREFLDSVPEYASLVSQYDLLYISDWAVYRGYFLVLLSTEVMTGHGEVVCLFVVNFHDNCFVGSISSVLGGTSTPELTRLIISTPEIDWSV